MTGAPDMLREEFAQRMERTRFLMDENGLDGLVVFSSYQGREGHVGYLTNHYNTFPNALSHRGFGMSAVIFNTNEPGLLVCPLGCESERLININEIKEGIDFVQDIVSGIKEKRLKQSKIGIVGWDILPIEYFEMLKKSLGQASFVKADNIVEKLRRIKSLNEIALLRKATSIADKALLVGSEMARSGVIGQKVELAMSKAAFEAGAEAIAYTKISFGATLHSPSLPTNSKQIIGTNDFVHLSVAGWVDGYAFNNSRIKTAREPKNKQIDFLNEVVEATEWMIERISPEAELSYVLTMHRDRSIKPFGHGIGMEISEPPWLLMGGPKTLIEPNMVITLRPKVFDNRFGWLEIAETLIVTNTGSEVLNEFPKRLW